MKTFIACNDPSLSTRISSDLRQVGIDCPPSNLLSLDSAPRSAAANDADRGAALVFFACQQFSPDDFLQLKQLCLAGQQIKVIAVGAASSPRVVLEAVHSGAADFLDITGDFAGELRNLFTRLKSTAQIGAVVGRLFTVIRPAGGAGASVLATNLAAALALRQQTCGLLDLHIRGGDLATLLKCQPRHTLLSLAGKAHQLDRAMFDQSLTKHECGIHLLASPDPFSDYRQITPTVIQQVVQLARASFPSVVVDLEDMEHAEQVRTLAASDRIIVPLRLDFVALYRTKKCIEHLLKSNVSADRITPIACRVGQPKELPVERFAEAIGLAIDYRIPDDPAAVNAAVNLGMPLVIASPDCKVSKCIVRLAESLIGKAGTAAPSDRNGRWRLPLELAASVMSLATR